MKITILGTGSCEGIPFLWCNCRVCTLARAQDGPDRRARTALAIDDRILVDFGEDVRSQCLKYNVDSSNVRYMVVTHSHTDHFVPHNLTYRSLQYTPKPLDLIGNDAVLDIMRPYAQKADINVTLRKASPGVWLDGDDGYRFFPVEATHCGPEEQALNYVIETPDHVRVLIGFDTGWYNDTTWNLLHDIQADIAVIEMSFGLRPPYDRERAYHLGATSTIEMTAELKRIGALKPQARVFATHISHCCNFTHEEIQAFYQRSGSTIVPAYDGMVITAP